MYLHVRMHPQNGVYVLHVQYPSDKKYKVYVIHTHLRGGKCAFYTEDLYMYMST